jgi:glucokinase
MAFLGIEIGGTKLQVGIGDGLGTVHHLHRVAANPAGGAEAIRHQILQACHDLWEKAHPQSQEVTGCGIGFGGPVDDSDGNTIRSHQVDGWENFPLAEWAAQELGVPCVVGNDADVAGLAEATCGAGRSCDPVFYMNVGSGIGGALILGGKIHRGTGLGAGEIGHLWVDYDVDLEHLNPDECWSILEHRASGWALQKAATVESVPALLQAIQHGDKAAHRVWVNARRQIALALSHVIALVCPQRIVIGGGVSLAPDELFLQPLREEVAQIVFKPFADTYDIQCAELGEAVVVQGALILARQRFA